MELRNNKKRIYVNNHVSTFFLVQTCKHFLTKLDEKVTNLLQFFLKINIFTLTDINDQFKAKKTKKNSNETLRYIRPLNNYKS